MVLNDHPDVWCHRHRCRGRKTRAAAFVLTDSGYGIPWCDPCLDDIRADPDPVAYDVVYLDPTRQRRPDPQHDPDLGPGIYDYPHAPAP